MGKRHRKKKASPGLIQREESGPVHETNVLLRQHAKKLLLASTYRMRMSVPDTDNGEELHMRERRMERLLMRGNLTWHPFMVLVRFSGGFELRIREVCLRPEAALESEKIPFPKIAKYEPPSKDKIVGFTQAHTWRILSDIVIVIGPQDQQGFSGSSNVLQFGINLEKEKLMYKRFQDMENQKKWNFQMKQEKEEDMEARKIKYQEVMKQIKARNQKITERKLSLNLEEACAINTSGTDDNTIDMNNSEATDKSHINPETD